ncbi:hypothetical protein Q3V37_17540 [Micromonospora profundi]|uniref:Uncharacterized protein n=1 Tax=Micromonospora profundi TaxID=1420889 RepID=A0AAJ6HRE9_9ACTN|nr:hypothetical protein [Micromonospora profundi]WLS43225.1 hypothetical protein Q3V37_17540 [Micromonospora profundi]
MTSHPPAAPAAGRGSPHEQPARGDDGPQATNGGDNGATRPPAAAVLAGSPAPESGRQAGSARRKATSPTTRDALDVDLATAVRHAAWMRQAFYVLVLLVALVGQVTGAVETLGAPVIVAVPAVAALELGGVVVMANADVRRRLGEQAILSRLLSAAIAAGATTFNWAAHPDHLVGGFYAGMSALGYLVWLMHAGNQRRDRLRVTGGLPPTPPAYEVFGHWICHPVITSQARSIAKADSLDLYESLTAARDTIARRQRDAAIAKVLHRKIRAAVDPITADIAVHVYDLNEIAARLAVTADYNGLTTLLAADLAPERIMTVHSLRHRRRWFRRERIADAPPVSDPVPSAPQAPTASVTDTPRDDREPITEPDENPQPAPSGHQQSAESRDAGPPEALSPDDPAVADPTDRTVDDKDVLGANVDEKADGGDQNAATDDANGGEDSEVPRGTAQAVAYWLRKEPNLDPELLAERIGKSLRTVYRYLPPDYPRRPGIARRGTRRQPGPAERASHSE